MSLGTDSPKISRRIQRCVDRVGLRWRRFGGECTAASAATATVRDGHRRCPTPRSGDLRSHASDVASVQSTGIDAYISAQLALPATQYSGYSYTPHTAPADCKNDGSNPPDAASLCARDQYSPFQVQRDFFTHALNNPDQLRQRVAFALSQIMVVSSVEIYEAYGLADFQNILLNDALGNYRTLLQDVTLSPTMGHYLDMANSDETNPANGTVPNQNYAREVLQLFSIGLVELNQDGSQQLDATGAPIPTYAPPTIVGLCHRVHRLDLSAAPRCELELDQSDQLRWTDGLIPEPSPGGYQAPAEWLHRAGRTNARAGSRERPRQHLQSSERGPVHRQAADPAPRD